MKAKAMIAGVVASIAVTAHPGRAHHAFSVEFDVDQPLQLRGRVVMVEWINPHAWFHLDVTDEDGAVTRWRIEAGTPNALFRRGVTRDSLAAGTEIVVDGYRARDGTNTANGRDMTFPDGRRIFLSNQPVGDRQ